MILSEFNEIKFGKYMQEIGWEDGWEDGVEHGILQGRNEGEMLKLISLVQTKQRKGKTLEDIAEETEESEEIIQPILALVIQYPYETREKILEMLMKKK